VLEVLEVLLEVLVLLLEVAIEVFLEVELEVLLEVFLCVVAFIKYEEQKNAEKKKISNDLLNFIKFLIKSNSAFKFIEEKEFYQVLNPNLKLVSFETLTDRMIPAFNSLNSL
jgi:hypothetical protein